MSAAHLHLILAHVPVVGLFLSLALLGLALWRRNAAAQQIALAGLVFSGLVALGVYFSGEGAEETVEHLPAVSQTLIERHEQAAYVAAILTVITGALAGLAWWRLWRGRPGRVLSGVVAASALIAFAVIGWTANLGGQIRHAEIRYGAGAAQGGAGGEAGEAGESGEEEEEDDDDALRSAPESAPQVALTRSAAGDFLRAATPAPPSAGLKALPARREGRGAGEDQHRGDRSDGKQGARASRAA